MHHRPSRILLLAVIAGALDALPAGAKKQPDEAGGVKAPVATFDVALYHQKGQPLEPLRPALVKVIARTPFVLVDTPGNGTAPRPTVGFASLPPEEFRAPPREVMDVIAPGLGEMERAMLARSETATVLHFVLPAAQRLERYRDALRIVRALDEKVGGIPFDDTARLAISKSAWNERIDRWEGGFPSVLDHINLHAYRDGTRLRLVTIGMERFGLPDLAVDGVSEDEAQEMALLIGAIGQRLLEGAAPDAKNQIEVAIARVRSKALRAALEENRHPGAAGKVVVTVVPGRPHEGDAENRVLDLLFPGDETPMQQRHADVLRRLFGANPAPPTPARPE